MSRRFFSLVAASHLAVILGGLWLGRPSAVESRFVAEPVAPPSARPVRPLAPVSTPAAAFQSTNEWSGREFSGAWQALKETRLSRSERTKTQRRLLDNWARRDLASALEAALGENWYDEPGQEVLQETLFEVFSGPFAEDPQRAWDMIASGRFGIDTGLLRHLWIQTVGDKDPLFLIARIGSLPEDNRQEALNASAVDIQDEATREAAFAILSKLPEGVITSDQLARFAELRFEK